ncbi:lachesin-like [Daktulosphaira vitifoliae]|uniref:lachesin-like n=1 Tax=Daktulosphaira vitifoliae TaxID=58002 RepID=UPI0021AACE63|nr:lachesin-like [Daktulosphaira vitifoliae]
MWPLAVSLVAWIAYWFIFSVRHIDVFAIDSTGTPKFGEDLNNVTVPVGREAVFVCNVDGLSTFKVAWLRVDTQTILTIHSHVITKNHRIAVTHSDHRIWYLHIREVKEADRGWYMCQINTDPMKSQQGYLEVVVPPDILDYPTSTDIVAREGGNVSLQCAASGFPTPSITWRREGSQLIQMANGPSVSTIEGSWLNISKVNRLHMGAYLCIASNGIPPSVSKRIMLIVHFPPMIWIQNQLVGLYQSDSVTLECHSEAYPKSIDYWTKDKSTLISNGTKYHTELVENTYKTLMKLTIHSVSSLDFGMYQCISKNSLGDTDGSIKLYEIPRPTTTTTTTEATTTTKKAMTTTRKSPSKLDGTAPANDLDRRPSKKTGKHGDANVDANKKDRTGGERQTSRTAAAVGENNGSSSYGKKHKSGANNTNPVFGILSVLIMLQKIFLV